MYETVYLLRPRGGSEHLSRRVVDGWPRGALLLGRSLRAGLPVGPVGLRAGVPPLLLYGLHEPGVLDGGVEL